MFNLYIEKITVFVYIWFVLYNHFQFQFHFACSLLTASVAVQIILLIG